VINPVAGDDIAVIGGSQQIAPTSVGGDPRKAGCNRRHRQFVVVVIGLFSVSEILLMLESTSGGQKAVRASGRMMFNMK
ncbi:hypothetical protein HZD82_27860, partial [Pantoea agglomerans]|nr:hypothetical protein [Pantoea agglomerans]